jgi:hypothetical protein
MQRNGRMACLKGWSRDYVFVVLLLLKSGIRLDHQFRYITVTSSKAGSFNVSTSSREVSNPYPASRCKSRIIDRSFSWASSPLNTLGVSSGILKLSAPVNLDTPKAVRVLLALRVRHQTRLVLLFWTPDLGVPPSLRCLARPEPAGLSIGARTGQRAAEMMLQPQAPRALKWTLGIFTIPPLYVTFQRCGKCSGRRRAPRRLSKVARRVPG